MSRARRERVRIHPCVAPEIAQLLAEYSAARGLSASVVVQDALRKHIDRTGDMDLVVRRLDRLSRQSDRVERDQGLLMEAFAVFVQVWLAYAPKMTDDAREFARRTSQPGYAQFMQRVVERYTGGPRFLDDLPRELLADDAELTEIAARPSPPNVDGQPPSSSATSRPPAGGG